MYSWMCLNQCMCNVSHSAKSIICSTICLLLHHECIYPNINDPDSVFRPSPESVVYARVLHHKFLLPSFQFIINVVKSWRVYNTIQAGNSRKVKNKIKYTSIQLSFPYFRGMLAFWVLRLNAKAPLNVEDTNIFRLWRISLICINFLLSYV